MKECKKCKQLLKIEKFGVSKRTLADGSQKNYVDSVCMVCRRKAHLEKEGKKEIHRQGSMRWYYNNPEKAKEQRLRKYGITLEDYNNKRKEQGYCCAICGEHESSVSSGRSLKAETSLNVDHCHETKKVRGLLCVNCNTLLGKAKDNILILENAINYLANYNDILGH